MQNYCQISNIRCTLVGNKIVDHSDVVGALSVGAAPTTGVYTKFFSRLSEESFPWLIQKFPCILLFKTGQPGPQLNLSEGQIRLDLTSGRPLV